MAIRILYFAAARELCGVSEEDIALPAALSGAALLQLVAERHPRIAPLLGRMRLALNGELVTAGCQVHDGDEVAVLPPVAGGTGARSPLVALRGEPLSVDEAIAAVRHPAAGGLAVFIGLVRDHADGKQVARLDYEAYEEIALREMRRILVELEAAEPGVRLAAAHRVGELSIGDLAVVVAASAPHRAEAFAACRAAIDRIKETVPIWKKEWSPNGEALWVNLESDQRT